MAQGQCHCPFRIKLWVLCYRVGGRVQNNSLAKRTIRVPRVLPSENKLTILHPISHKCLEISYKDLSTDRFESKQPNLNLIIAAYSTQPPYMSLNHPLEKWVHSKIKLHLENVAIVVTKETVGRKNQAAVMVDLNGLIPKLVIIWLRITPKKKKVNSKTYIIIFLEVTS